MRFSPSAAPLGSSSKESRPAILLASGGVDSTTLLALVTKEGCSVNALTFRYGQRHGMEVERARRIAERYRVARHVVAEIDLRIFGGSALTGDMPVPKHRSIDPAAHDVPATYVPARNTIFLSFALAWAEVLGASDIFIGVNAIDYSGYPDCRPEYIRAFETMANLATRSGVEGTNRVQIRTPLIDLGKKQIIELGRSLGVDYAMTTSCYDPASDGTACGSCDACQLRKKGFAEAGISDPAAYVP
ncbi:MAG TPA: 7-cyano-7-deazaguanine synthase QueC [Gemmatimonadaceae bacterium]|nr:7-cyano-7-deazaguanine synthase QueC [Gemmatimonadaceae bacterium]